MISVIFHNNEDNLHLLSVSHTSIRRWVRGCCLPLQTPETHWEDAAVWLRPVLGRCTREEGLRSTWSKLWDTGQGLLQEL